MQEASDRWVVAEVDAGYGLKNQVVRTSSNTLTYDLYWAYIDEDFMLFAGRANSRAEQNWMYKKVSPPGQTVGSTKTVVFGLVTPSTGKVLLRRGVTSPMHSMHWRRGTQVGI